MYRKAKLVSLCVLRIHPGSPDNCCFLKHLDMKSLREPTEMAGTAQPSRPSSNDGHLHNCCSAGGQKFNSPSARRSCISLVPRPRAPPERVGSGDGFYWVRMRSPYCRELPFIVLVILLKHLWKKWVAPEMWFYFSDCIRINLRGPKIQNLPWRAYIQTSPCPEMHYSFPPTPNSKS